MADAQGPWTQYQSGSSGSAPNAGPWTQYQAAPAANNTPEALGIPKYKGDFSGAMLHGASFGLSDEIESGLSAPLMYGVDKLTGKAPDGATLGDYYDANLSNIRGGLADYAKEHPIASGVGEAAGGLLDVNPTAAIGTVAKGVGAAVKEGAKVGSALGAVTGFGNSEGDVENRLKGTAAGAAGGAVTGAAAPVAIPWLIGAGRGVTKMVSNAIAPWTSSLDDFISQTAGKVLNEAAGPAGAHFETPPLHGMQPTTGQATDNPGLKWLERSVEQSTPEAAAASADARTANNQAIHTAIGSLGDTTSDASLQMSNAVEKAANAAKVSTRAAWKAAGVDETTGISAPQLQQHVGDYLGTLTVASRKNIDPGILETLGELANGGTTNLGEIQDLRSNVTDALRTAARSGQGNKARVLGGLADTISDFIDNIPRPDGAAEAYEAARAATKQMKQTFNQPKAVRNVLAVDSFGADKTPLSATADTFIRSGKGAPEVFQSYLDAVNSDPDALQAARDAFTQRFLNRVQTTASDQSGSSIISAAKVSNFIDDHAHIIDSRIFDNDQRDLIARIGQAADMSQRTARAGAPGGSDTYGKLQGKTFLDALIGPGASKLIPAVGATIGFHSGGPIGAAAGFAAASVGENKLENLLYGATRDKVVALVHEAMSNPGLAKTLMQTASAKASLQIPAPQRRLIYSILGAQAPQPLLSAVSGSRDQGQRASTQ